MKELLKLAFKAGYSSRDCTSNPDFDEWYESMTAKQVTESSRSIGRIYPCQVGIGATKQFAVCLEGEEDKLQVLATTGFTDDPNTFNRSRSIADAQRITDLWNADVAHKRFSYVDIATPKCEGWLNLFFDDEPIALINVVDMADRLRLIIPERIV